MPTRSQDLRGDTSEERHGHLWKVIGAATVGNVLEWYDFALFGYFAVEISNSFFPKSNDEDRNMLYTFAIFGASFLVRPFGGLLFGYIGDKALGRKKALQIAIIMTALPTFLLGCLPGYNSIGVAAPVLLLVLRLVQGLAAGGQLIGSFIAVYENSEDSKSNFYGSICFGTVSLGVLCASVVSGIVHAFTTPADLEDYGWRVPFLLGSLISLLGCGLQRLVEIDVLGITESSVVKSQSDSFEVDAGRFNPIMIVFKWHKTSMILIGLVSAIWPVAEYICFIWLPTFKAKQFPDGNEEAPYLVTPLSLSIQVVTMPLFGLLSDQIGAGRMIKSSSILIMALSPFLFGWLFSCDKYVCMVPQSMFAVLTAAFGSALPVTLCRAFPTKIRYSGLAFSYNAAQVLFGATAPVIATELAETTRYFLPGVYISLISVVSLIAAVMFSYKSEEIAGIDSEHEHLGRPNGFLEQEPSMELTAI
eukprot:CAMPEP_0184006406 /NCGR_PEP_ID=MMETSP0954-20121128/667_1 /TAXON_ID=627963 /ORGANISM="Aplanochytrium sp, Strain PBS07" /LENGTH=474 /DNA_ID=CAMNT_0026284935 /DNA_START=158 /DNA_END=1582 /DNA_ORIENTATION=-